jgi:hypothetical protein
MTTQTALPNPASDPDLATAGVGEGSRAIYQASVQSRAHSILRSLPPSSLAEELFDARARAKQITARLAMPMLHLSREWRDRFFSQLDGLMDVEQWDPEDRPVTEASFTTLIRMLVLLASERRPGLGASSDGHIVAVWAKDRNRLTIECLGGDAIRWVVLLYHDNQREIASGENQLDRLNDILQPYHPGRFFDHERPTASC